MSNFCCPIETEPRTLNQDQLNFAREVAADAAQKMELDKASIVLKEELNQVVLLEIEQNDEGLQLQNSVEAKEDKVIERPCQCKEINTIVGLETPDQSHLKEPLSAPF